MDRATTMTSVLLKVGPVLLGLALHAGTTGAAECPAAPVSHDPTIAEIIDPIVDTAVTEGFAGGVALSRGSQIVYRRVAGFADHDGAVAVTPATLFEVASMTKYFTAIAMLKAVEEGKVALDDPIAPWIGTSTLAAHPVTFADLLAHRSGLGSSYAAESIGEPQAALDAIAAAGIDASQAGAFRYSNDGYDVLGVVLERIYGRPYEQVLRTQVLAPACLTHFGFWGETDLDDPRQVSQPLTEFPASLRGRSYGMLASGGLLTTAEDLVRFQDALQAGRVIGPSMLAALYAPRGEISIGSATFGAFIVDRPGLGSTLSARGYEDWGDNGYLNDYLDCDVTLAVVTSRGPAEDSGRQPFRVSISEAIEEQLLQGLCGASSS